MSITSVYPRTRGATVAQQLQPLDVQGLSPHARGNLNAAHLPERVLRSIPARAGQPACRATVDGAPKVYPRTRGATCSRRAGAAPNRGLSPHARGNP